MNKLKRDMVPIGEFIPDMTKEEKEMHVLKFDMLKFDGRIRQICQQILSPFLFDQKKILRKQDKINDDLLNHDRKYQDSLLELERATNALQEQKDISSNIVKIEQELEVLKSKSEDIEDQSRNEIDSLKITISKFHSDMLQCKHDIKVQKQLVNNNIKIHELISLMEQYKQQIEMLFEQNTRDITDKMNKLQNRCSDAVSKCDATLRKYDTCRNAIVNADVRVQKLQDQIQKVVDTQDEFKQLSTFLPRIEFLEKESRQSRIMLEENVNWQRIEFRKYIKQRKVEETILKYNFDMLDSIFGKELMYQKQSDLITRSQLKINYSRWKMQIIQKYVAISKQNFMNYDWLQELAVFDNQKLPQFGQLRTKNLLEILYSQKNQHNQLDDNNMLIRSKSIIGIKNGQILNKFKDLEEMKFTEKEFIVSRPQNYIPQYLKPPEEVKYVEPELPLILRPNYERKLKKSHEGDSEEDRLEFEREKRRAKRQYEELCQIREEQHQRKIKLAQENALHEYWKGIKLEFNEGIVNRKVNIKRTYSTNKNWNGFCNYSQKQKEIALQELLEGQESNSQESDQQQMQYQGNIQNSYINSPNPESSISYNQQNGNQSINGGKQQNMIGQFLKGQNLNIGNMLGKEIGNIMKKGKNLQQQGKIIDGQQISNVVFDLQKQMKRLIQQFQTFQKPSTQRFQVDYEEAQWGKIQLAKTPHCPKGMQFVNVDHLINKSDLDFFQKQFKKQVDQSISQTNKEYDQKLQFQLTEIQTNLNDTILEIKDSNTEYINVLIKDLVDKVDEKSQNQDASIDQIKVFVEEQIYNIKIEVTRKFLEQYLLNEQVNKQLKQNIKKICLINNDIEMKAQKMMNNNNQIQEHQNDLRTQFEHLLKFIEVQQEINVISNMLMMQDEVDKNQTSLWSITKNEKKKYYEPNQYLQLDEECLACSLEKYRPMIKEAFKMACISYKPSKIPMRGYQYERKHLIELNKKYMQDSWTHAIQNIDFYKSIYGGENGDINKFLNQMSIKLHENIKCNFGIQYGVDEIQELVFDKILQEQIIKNPSNMCALYDEINDNFGLEQFKSDIDQQYQKVYKELIKKQ